MYPIENKYVPQKYQEWERERESKTNLEKVQMSK